MERNYRQREFWLLAGYVEEHTFRDGRAFAPEVSENIGGLNRSMQHHLMWSWRLRQSGPGYLTWALRLSCL
jgi:hypothetical protein